MPELCRAGATDESERMTASKEKKKKSKDKKGKDSRKEKGKKKKKKRSDLHKLELSACTCIVSTRVLSGASSSHTSADQESVSTDESLSSDDVFREAQAVFGLRQKDVLRAQHMGKLDDMQPRQIACILACAHPSLQACDLLDLGGELVPGICNPVSPSGTILVRNVMPCALQALRFSVHVCMYVCMYVCMHDGVFHALGDFGRTHAGTLSPCCH